MGLLAKLNPAVVEILTAAQDEARSLGHGYIGTEHLLISLLTDGSGAKVVEARRQGASAERARDAARQAFAAVESPNRYVSDEEALAAVGVDLGAVRRAAEGEFGAGAIPMRVGAPPFTARAAAVLEHAAGMAAGGRADQDHLLLALLDDPDSVAARALASMTNDLPAVRAARGGAEDGTGEH
ncbi:MAG TPA: Clp protease N-terminal domain-containing protein [Nonomuraea sp.]|nr:Clp protease N-terminal domain-containing protein [Nonomuraea sp.]